MAVIKRTFSEKTFDLLNYVFMIILALFFIYPFWDTLVLSFCTPEGATRLGLRLIPDRLNLTAYKNVFANQLLIKAYFNTIFRTVVGSTLSVFITYCAAYSLSKKELPFNKFITTFILITMFFSGGLIPTYLNIKDLGLMNSLWSLILPLLTSAWHLIIARNFIVSLPSELEDAAFIDGAHPINIVFKIMLPLSLPILGVLTLWDAVAHWNAWFDAMIYIKSEGKIVLQLLLRRILIENSDEEMISLMTTGSTRTFTTESVKAATTIVAIGPIVLTYPFFQKYFVKGIMIGSLKG